MSAHRHTQVAGSGRIRGHDLRNCTANHILGNIPAIPQGVLG